MIATSSADAVSLNTIFPSTAVSDAFEAVTNGMHNPEALEQLYAEGTDSAEWVNMIHAIKAFYSQDFDAMDRLLQTVPQASKAAALKNVLYHMSGRSRSEEQLSYHEKKLSKRVTEDSRFLSSAIEQLKESIEYGEELFTETVSLLIKEVKKSPEAAERLTLWSFRICIENGFDDEALADNIMMLFGQAEGLRLIALSLIETEPESALICFTRSLIKKLVDRNILTDETTAYLKIIGALISACRDDDPVLLDLSEMLTMLESEIAIFNLHIDCRSSNPAIRVAALIEALTGKSSELPAAPEPRGEAVQLELF